MSIECKHGYLARACDRCEIDKLLAQLAQQRKIVDAMLTESSEAGAAYLSKLRQIEKLRAFVAAWDALGEAKTSQCTCASFVIQYEGCCCGRSRRTRAAETELLAAREAVGAIPPTEPPHTPRT